ncbi:hypothetical protein D9M69_589080 [compost metagenome]
MVIQVLGGGIVGGYPIHFLRLADVPTHEIHGIGKVVPVCSPVTGLLAIVTPGIRLGLAVSIGGTYPPPWNEPQNITPRWKSIAAETRFLLHEGHRYMQRDIPARLHVQRTFVPA